MTTKIYYIHDPMCSWCWAFRPALDALNDRLPNHLQLEYLLGGLAKDTDEPMPDELRYQIQNHWRTIQIRMPETKFNFEFWNKCHPRRSTYPACRAVLAAKIQDIKFEEPMIRAIQHAYYCQARNPSNTETLIKLADEINLDVKRFTTELNSEKNRELLKREIAFARQIGGNAFPMLLLGDDNMYHQILIDYNHPKNMIKEINRFLTHRNHSEHGSSTNSGE
ncbi:MAG: DsbA family protein [Gammaproteobacteria bacterium]|nr:DsbA family protein [Gammaproteobacteria bacterium]